MVDTALSHLNEINLRHGVGKSPAEKFSRWNDAIQTYGKLRKTAIIDLIADTTNISAKIIHASNVHRIDPLAKQAILEANPTLDLSDPPSGDELMGAINSAKGLYFELLIADKLNSGERVGDCKLPSGYSVVRAASQNQTEWDLKIVDENRDISEFLQLKATNSFSYIKEALAKYPDMQILATSEVAAEALDNSTLIFNSEISNQYVTSQVKDVLLMEDLSFGELFFESFSPLFAISTILATEGLSITVNKKDIDNSVRSTFERLSKSLAAQTIASVFYACGGGLFAIPAGIATKYFLEIGHNYMMMNELIVKCRIEMLQLRIFQQNQLLLESSK